MPLTIDYFSDVLCIWAWIAERRQEELRQHFGDKIEIRHRYVSVFGDTRSKIEKNWGARGGFEGFGEHVVNAAAPFPDAPVDGDIWKTVRPRSSTTAHISIKAVERSYSAEAAENFARHLRERFFVGLEDIGRLETLFDIAGRDGLDIDKIRASIDEGAAVAEIMGDYEAAHAQSIKGSPTWVMDGGRQTLYGNVGYRVLRANVAELLDQPQDEASWC